MDNKKSIWKYIVLATYILLVGSFFFFSLRTSEKSVKESTIATDAVEVIGEAVTFKQVEFDYDTLYYLTRKMIGHYGYNALMGLFCFLVIYMFKKRGNFALAISLIIGVVIAIAGELLQFIPEGRVPDSLDAVFNILGEVAGLLFIYVIILLKERKTPKND